MTALSLPEVLIKHRSDNDPAGPTFGDLTGPGGFECVTLERPALGDHPCIGTGSWKVHAFQHPEHGLCYEVIGVNGRTGILFHSANIWAQLLGCIALGRAVMIVEGDWHKKDGTVQHFKEMGVSSSVDAVKAFWSHMGGLDFILTIS